jgi:hypothetical protein
MLMTERGIVVTEMLQLWNAAPETFVKQLGMYTATVPGAASLVGHVRFLTGTEAHVPSPSLACKGNAEDCTEGLQCERRVGS